MNTHNPKNLTVDPVSDLSLNPDSSGLSFPEQLTSKYKILSCLKYSEQSSTYLVKQITSGKTALLKVTGDFLFAETLINEKNILDFIHQQDLPAVSGFPKNIEVIQTQETYYYLRTYIEGKTLEELCESNLKKPGMATSLALNYVLQLTELLQFLHNLKPPIIHRDIKPQNVVVDSNGVCHFIDMGISRFFDKTKKSDTLIMGTRITAPPEQFGYHQTDIRSDLYSLGIVLYYCLTGEYEINEKTLSELEPALQKIITKATMFDPDKRYQTTEELLPDLLTARYHLALPAEHAPEKPGRSHWGVIALLLGINVALAGALLYQNYAYRQALSVSGSPKATDTSVSEQNITETTYTFKEPMIEDAAREILSIPDAPITKNDLEKITSLHIMGLQIYSDDSEIWFQGNYPYAYEEDLRTTGLYLQTGTISSLEDILHMPNLKTLSLYKQQISDISPLQDTRIENLGLGYNPVTDLSPLQGNTSIKYLNLVGTPISSADLLSTLPNLETLNIGSTAVPSIAGLENCRLKELDIFEVDLNDFSEIRQLPYLENLTLYYMNQEMLETLSGLPLKELSFRKSPNVTLEDFSVLPKLESLYFTGNGDYLEVSDLNLPNLKVLNLLQVKIRDFSGFSSLTSLHTLHIYDAECESFDGLEQLPSLRYISGTAEQKKMFQENYPESNYLFVP